MIAIKEEQMFVGPKLLYESGCPSVTNSLTHSLTSFFFLIFFIIKVRKLTSLIKTISMLDMFTSDVFSVCHSLGQTVMVIALFTFFPSGI